MSLDVKTRSQAILGNRLSRQRLADISHHFLSDKNARAPIWQNTHIVPVLLSSRFDDYIVYQLDRALKAQKTHTSMVLNIEAHMSNSNPITAWQAGNRLDPEPAPEAEPPKLPDFCLIPVTSPSTTLALQSDRLILAVHASLGGARLAYNQLSFLSTFGTNFNVCVVMFGASTPKAASRFYDFLCHNAQSLLELELENGGYLLDDEARFSDTHRESFTRGITEVAQGIIDCFTRKKKAADAERLALSTGPTAYLT